MATRGLDRKGVVAINYKRARNFGRLREERDSVIMKSEYKIIILSIIVAITFWLTDALLDYWNFYDKPFLTVLLLDKREVCFRLLASSFFIASGILVARAFSHQRCCAKELLRTKNYLQTIIETEPECIKLLARDGTLLDMNRAGLEMIEADSLDQVKGKSLYALIPPEYRQEFESLTGKAFEGISGKMEFEIVGLKGRRLWLETHAVPIRYSEDEIFASLCITRDITARKQAEKEVRELNLALQDRAANLEQSNNDLESFTYMASHGLREPLMVIEWSCNNLLEKYGDVLDDEGKEKFAFIRGTAKQMSQRIKDLLSFSRIRTTEVVKSDIDMEALANEVFTEMTATTADREIRFEVRDLPHAWGDPRIIHQVIANLLSNALKYTRSKATAMIEVGGFEKQGQNIYYVRDNGIGFDSADSETIFGLFQRLPRSQEVEGTGVGLVITHRIIEKHGGRVWAEGRVNEGATFYFSLPAAAGRIPRGCSSEENYSQCLKGTT